MYFDEFSWILTNYDEKRIISRLSINEEPGAMRERVIKMRDVFVAKSYAENEVREMLRKKYGAQSEGNKSKQQRG